MIKMSKEFDLDTNLIEDGEQALRVKAVESALTLLNTAMATTGNVSTLIKNIRDGDTISLLADKIEAAAKK